MRRRRSPKNNNVQVALAKREFALWEFALAAAILAVLAGTLLERVGFYQREAELAAVRHTVAVLRGALQVRSARHPAGQRGTLAPAPGVENPIDWLAAKPANYLGEYDAPEVKNLQEGNWYFDRSDNTLVYLLNDGKGFASGTSILLKYKVKLLTFPNSTAQSPGLTGSTGSVVLDQVFDEAAVTGTLRR